MLLIYLRLEISPGASETVAGTKHEHNHDPENRSNEKVESIGRCKRKVSEDISARPFKVIRTELQDMTETNLQPQDIRAARKAMYRTRRKMQPPRPKTRTECQPVSTSHRCVML